jgi:phospholipid/cholesterol/gamma-HCH transport system ATP-binding protein
MKTQPIFDGDSVTTPKKIVKIRSLYKSFGDRKVLENFNLDLFERENLVILGKSGSGKSVLIKCMVGLLKPDSGTITVLGYNVPSLTSKELNALRLKVGFSFQGSALYDSMSVRENLEFPLKRNLGIFDKAKLRDMVTTALQDVGLESGGMKKRIGIARTLILNPEIMLYDEPTAGLDPETSAEINELILTVRDKYHTSSVIITHDISCAHKVSDRIVALFDGRNKLEGTFEELKDQNSKELQSFFNY